MSSEQKKADTTPNTDIKNEKVIPSVQENMELSDADLDQVIGAHGKY